MSPEFLTALEQVPYLLIDSQSPNEIQFRFRGTKGFACLAELGLCIALAFPVDTPASYMQAQQLCSVLSSGEHSLDLGLQREQDCWLLWKRFDIDTIVYSPTSLQAMLDDMLAAMRFLYARFLSASRKHNPPTKNKTLAVQFV